MIGFASREAVERVLDQGIVFELTYRDDGDERTYLVTHREPDRPSAVPRDGPPTFLFETVDADETHTVRLPDLIDLAPIPFEAVPESVAAQAPATLREGVAAEDEQVPDATLTRALEQADGPEGDTLAGLELGVELLNAREEAVATFGREILSLLTDTESKLGLPVVTEFVARARSAPERVEPAVPELRAIAATDTPYRHHATACLMEIAEVNPTAVLDAVPALATAARADEKGTRSFAVYALARIADTYPEEVYPAVPALLESIGAADDTLRTNALSAIGALAGVHPEAAEPIADRLVGLVEDEAKRVRANALGLFGDIARAYPEVGIEHADAIAARLTDRHSQARINASIALLEAGEADPDAVAATHEYLEAALDDASSEVRANACTLIGNSAAPVSAQKLRELRKTDPNDRVREQAAFALERLA